MTAGARAIALPALPDDGAPAYDHDNVAALAVLGVLAFACTLDAFRGLMAAGIGRWDIGEWTRRALGAWGLEPFCICVQWEISLPARRALWHVCL